MGETQAIRTLRFQLSKRDSVVGPGLKKAIREAIIALEEKQAREEGGKK